MGPISLTLLFAIIVKSVANLKWLLKGLMIILDFTNSFEISDQEKIQLIPMDKAYC